MGTVRRTIVERIREPQPRPDHIGTCQNKEWFATEKDAQYGSLKRAYKCTECNGWHRTSKVIP